MKRTWTVTVFKHEQPSERVWRRLIDGIRSWNHKSRVKFAPMLGSQDSIWCVGFDLGTQSELIKLCRHLDELKKRHGVTYHRSTRSHIEEDDYDKADFIEILGRIHHYPWSPSY